MRHMTDDRDGKRGATGGKGASRTRGGSQKGREGTPSGTLRAPHGQRSASGASRRASARRRSDTSRAIVTFEQRYYRRARKRAILVVLAVIVITVTIVWRVSVGAYANAVDEKLRSNLSEDAVAALSAPANDESAYYGLVIGVDDGGAENQQTYGLILVRVDPKAHAMCCVSIPSEIPVEVEGQSACCIGETYAAGGCASVIKAASWLAGVPISHFVEVKLSRLPSLVDGVGGLELHVPEAVSDSSVGEVTVEPGDRKINGAEAELLARATFAYANGEVSCMANQRAMLIALVREISSHRLVFLANEIDSIADDLCTDMTSTQLRGFAHCMHGLDISQQVYCAAVPTTSTKIDGEVRLLSDTGAWQAMMNRVDAGQAPTDIGYEGSTSVVSCSQVASNYRVDIQNGSGVSGCGQEAADKLAEAAYQIGKLGNTEAFGYSKTLIVYADNSSLPAAQSISQKLGLGDVVAASKGDYKFSGDVLVIVGKDWIP